MIGSNSKKPQFDIILKYSNPVYDFETDFAKIHATTILPHMPGSPKWYHL
jgi:hypothetical protein